MCASRIPGMGGAAQVFGEVSEITIEKENIDVPRLETTVAQRNAQQTRSNAHLVERLRAWL